jgi:hypothetical protein
MPVCGSVLEFAPGGHNEHQGMLAGECGRLVVITGRRTRTRI